MGKGEAEDALRALLSVLTLSCLRSPALQKLCGAALPAAASSAAGVGSSLLGAVGATDGPPARTSAQSLLHCLCTLTPKYYKDKRSVLYVLFSLPRVDNYCCFLLLLLLVQVPPPRAGLSGGDVPRLRPQHHAAGAPG